MSRKISKIRNWPFKSNPSLKVDVKKKKKQKKGIEENKQKKGENGEKRRHGDLAKTAFEQRFKVF